MARFLLGLILGLLIVPAAVWSYLRFGHPPVAVADAPFPFEKQIVRAPLHARIDREMPASSPVAATPENLMAGAQTYREQCAACHGLPQRSSPFAAHMYPRAPQLWQWHRTGVIGVNDDPVGETYWKIDNGIRLTGMPSFSKVLDQTQMWQVAVLLKSAGTTLPDPVVKLLGEPIQFNPPAAGGQ
ncbi:MAG TPA: cytochrome c [Acidobacteriaceae bacterium]|nr:cytochrome c [Acidobacteriaceae bacterium]